MSNVSNGTRSVLFNPRHLEGMISFTMIFPFLAFFIGLQEGNFLSISCFLSVCWNWKRWCFHHMLPLYSDESFTWEEESWGPARAVQVNSLSACSYIDTFLSVDTSVSVRPRIHQQLFMKIATETHRPLFFFSFGFGSRFAVTPSWACSYFPCFQECLHVFWKKYVSVHSLCFYICDEAAKFLSATTGSDICRERFKDDWPTRDKTGRMSNVKASYHLGTGGGITTMNFRENSKRPWTPPSPPHTHTHFRKITLQFFSEKPSFKSTV